MRARNPGIDEKWLRFTSELVDPSDVIIEKTDRGVYFYPSHEMKVSLIVTLCNTVQCNTLFIRYVTLTLTTILCLLISFHVLMGVLHCRDALLGIERICVRK